MEKLIIDRFEGNIAVCEKEDESLINILRSQLPMEAIEGSCVIKNADGTFTLDEDEYKKRQENISKLMEELFE